MKEGHYHHRLPLKSLRQYKKGFVCGRIEALDEQNLYLKDEEGRSHFKHSLDTGSFKSGDLVKIYFYRQHNEFYIDKIILLNSVIINPLNDSQSAYYRLQHVNEKLRNTLYRRQIFFQAIRDFFVKRKFLELHSPTLVESPGIEYHIEPFVTSYKDYNGESHCYYLPTSPEFSLKEALSAGLENIFEIGKVFRNNGEKSLLHRPEFFMLEWYRAYENYEAIMDDCEDLLRFIGEKVYKKRYIDLPNNRCDLSQCQRIPLKDLFAQFRINLDDYALNEDGFIHDLLAALNLKHDYYVENKLNKEDLFFKFFMEKIELTLGWQRPTIVYEYPAEMAALSRLCDDNPLYAKRFELYIGGIELANAFDELIDPIEQEKRFNQVIAFRNENNKALLKMPHRFLKALQHGLPPCAGIALGIERLFMLFESISHMAHTNLYD